MIVQIRLTLMIALGIRSVDFEPILIPDPEEEADEAVAFFSGVEIYLAFIMLRIGKLEELSPL